MPNSLLDDLFSYWSLDETQSTRVDSHGVFHMADDGAGAIQANTVIRNSAADGDGTDRRLTSDSTSSGPWGGSWSVNFWAEHTAGNDNKNSLHVGKWNNTGDNRAMRILFRSSAGAPPNGEYQVGISEDGTAEDFTLGIDPPAGNDNSPVMLTVVYDASLSVMSLYYEGTGVTSASCGPMYTTAQPLTLCYHEGVPTYDPMDECGLWARALNGTDVIALYNGGSGTFYADFEATPDPPNFSDLTSPNLGNVNPNSNRGQVPRRSKSAFTARSLFFTTGLELGVDQPLPVTVLYRLHKLPS